MHTSAASVDGSERLRLFCALRLPDDAVDDARRLAAARASRARPRIVPRENLHVTLAFLGCRPAGELAAIAAALRAAAASGQARSGFALRGYRETRSVGMLIFDDEGGARRRLPSGCTGGSRRSASTGARARRGSRTSRCSGSASRPRLEPSLPELGTVVSVRRGCLLSRAAARRGPVRGSRIGCAAREHGSSSR